MLCTKNGGGSHNRMPEGNKQPRLNKAAVRLWPRDRPGDGGVKADYSTWTGSMSTVQPGGNWAPSRNR